MFWYCYTVDIRFNIYNHFPSHALCSLFWSSGWKRRLCDSVIFVIELVKKGVGRNILYSSTLFYYHCSRSWAAFYFYGAEYNVQENEARVLYIFIVVFYYFLFPSLNHLGKVLVFLFISCGRYQEIWFVSNYWGQVVII